MKPIWLSFIAHLGLCTLVFPTSLDKQSQWNVKYGKKIITAAIETTNLNSPCKHSSMSTQEFFN